MTPYEKAQAIKEFARMNWKTLAHELGLKSQQTFSDIKRGKHGLSKNLCESILERFPEINRDWLLFDEGEMLSKDAEFRTLVAGEESARFGLFKVGNFFRKAELAVKVMTDAMTEYPVGSIVLLSRVKDPAEITFGNNYYIESANNTWIRRLHKGNEHASYLLCATNRNLDEFNKPRYENLELPEDKIMRIFRILGYVMPQVDETIKL